MSLMKMLWYFLVMKLKGRVIPLERRKAIVTYFVTNDVKKCYKRPMWSIVKEDLNGRFIYLDKIVSRGVTIKKGKMWHYFKTRFPQIESVCWFRFNGNKNDLFCTYTKGVEHGKVYN